MEEINKIKQRLSEVSLTMSRVPPNVKREFMDLANAEFCGDYGLCFKNVWDNFKLWKMLFENMDMKLDIIIDKLNIPNEKSSDKKVIKTFTGRRIELEGGNQNGNIE